MVTCFHRNVNGCSTDKDCDEVMIQYVPLIQTQLELMELPRGRRRFDEYLRLMIGGQQRDVELPPLVVMNPMAKDHVRTMLKKLIDMDVDHIAHVAIAEAQKKVDRQLEFKIGIVIADDLAGGWTNRFDYEFKHRFYDPRVKHRQSKGISTYRSTWETAILWASEDISANQICQAIKSVIFRADFKNQHGHAETLRQQQAQEGFALNRSGWSYPDFTEEEIQYTRDTIQPFLDADDFRTSVECLFGDVAANSPRLHSSRTGRLGWAQAGNV